MIHQDVSKVCGKLPPPQPQSQTEAFWTRAFPAMIVPLDHEPKRNLPSGWLCPVVRYSNERGDRTYGHIISADAGGVAATNQSVSFPPLSLVTGHL